MFYHFSRNDSSSDSFFACIPDNVTTTHCNFRFHLIYFPAEVKIYLEEIETLIFFVYINYNYKSITGSQRKQMKVFCHFCFKCRRKNE